MGKVIVLLCFAFLAMTLVMCQEEAPCEPKPSCASNDDCCGNKCNPWAQKCTTAPDWIPMGPWGKFAGAPAAASGGAPALAWRPPWAGGWGGSWGWPWGGGWGGWGGPSVSRAASGAEWASEEEPAK